MCVRFIEEVSPERYNTNETRAQSNITLTLLSTKNFKTMGLWVFIGTRLPETLTRKTFNSRTILHSSKPVLTIGSDTTY